MKKPRSTSKRGLAKIATVDLVTMALLAGLDMGTKQIIHPVVQFITGPFNIPAGAVAGGVYMMWSVLAIGIIRKPGAATLTSAIESILSLLLPFGNFGVLSFVIYLLPGLAADSVFIVYLLTKQDHRFGLIGCFAASAAANLTGTFLVAILVLDLPIIPLLFSVILAAVFGGFGGIIANTLLIELRKIGIGVSTKRLVPAAANSNVVK
jgi:energy-coupling factor transport system substrate-specific component